MHDVGQESGGRYGEGVRSQQGGGQGIPAESGRCRYAVLGAQGQEQPYQGRHRKGARHNRQRDQKDPEPGGPNIPDQAALPAHIQAHQKEEQVQPPADDRATVGYGGVGEQEAARQNARRYGEDDGDVTPEQAKEMMEKDYMYYACLMCKCGDADGAVSGACHSTGNTIRPALQLLKCKPGVSSTSGFFLMEVPDCELGENGLFVFADCAVNIDPDSEHLAEIAALSAQSFEMFVGKPAKVAMLSFSSYGSAKHERVDLVSEATKIAKEKYPELAVDGELQLDAALVPEVAALKAPGSPVAGKANTLVFPSLEAGNIGYKLVQRLAKAEAYGPVLQGLSMPVNDLSRGCFADDIVGTVALTAVQAQMSK